ncbi:FHA domain-containing protein [Bifidobacterium callimiconis]|uniref:FHA domain-containing protein n=1 Tax=Bifidobacterium callimiconis TaxID=2306973 RepID=UPI001BDCD877|nr:FHA domain-containing protein [Bifidobacterium callimiconis]MBT1176550.1 FHA domain-containing protein [Bifidobacterium callimiconis]
MRRSIPYPPPPEPGWYVEDTMPGDASQAFPDDVRSQSAVVDDAPAPSDGSPYGNEEWDGTILSRSFIDQRPQHRYVLRNDATGQTVILDRSALLGRKPTKAVPEGVSPQKLDDPTRTISRNHAAVSFDREGRLWIEDYGSLNGTFLIVNGEETQVKGRPVKVTVPCTVRIGDQFFNLEEQRS